MINILRIDLSKKTRIVDSCINKENTKNEKLSYHIKYKYL